MGFVTTFKWSDTVLLISVVFVACSSVTEPALTAIPTLSWKTYNSETFLVTFNYPENWEIDDTGYAVSGQDGFFSISASSMGFPTAKETCENEVQVNSSGKGGYSYGTNPTLEILQVDNQPACLILPSDDQPQNQHGISVLVVEYPDLDQSHTRLLLFSADKDHIRNFISTLKFIH